MCLASQVVGVQMMVRLWTGSCFLGTDQWRRNSCDYAAMSWLYTGRHRTRLYTSDELWLSFHEDLHRHLKREWAALSRAGVRSLAVYISVHIATSTGEKPNASLYVHGAVHYSALTVNVMLARKVVGINVVISNTYFIICYNEWTCCKCPETRPSSTLYYNSTKW